MSAVLLSKNDSTQMGKDSLNNSKKFNLIDQLFIPHTAVVEAIERIEQCFEVSANALEPVCMMLIGESRTGKTRVFEFITSRHPKRRCDEGLIVPVLKVTTPSNPTVKGLAEVLLRQLGDPLPGKGTETNMTSRLITLLQAAKVRMTIVDEFQHFYDKQSNKVMHHVADWLKTVIDESKVSLIVGGLPSCQTVINQNEQLAGRFLGQIRMPRFNWLDDNDRDEFIGILSAFQQALPDYHLPDLTSDEMAFRFYCATGGLIGYLVKILRQALWNAVFSGNRIMDLKALKIAHQKAVYTDSSVKLIAAFDHGFTTIVTDELLANVSSVGLPKAPPVKSRGRSRIPNEQLTTGDVLRT